MSFIRVKGGCEESGSEDFGGIQQVDREIIMPREIILDFYRIDDDIFNWRLSRSGIGGDAISAILEEGLCCSFLLFHRSSFVFCLRLGSAASEYKIVWFCARMACQLSYTFLRPAIRPSTFQSAEPLKVESSVEPCHRLRGARESAD